MIRKIALFIITFILLILSVSADDGIITVLVPKSTTETLTEPTTSAEKPTVSAPKLYPVSVTENFANGQHEIVKIYELTQSENPSDIPCESFESGGWNYELSDITKKEDMKTEQKEQVDTVRVDSTTKDFDSILKLLPATKSYENDGFTGTLSLDADSITVEQAGTKSVAYTISETREYPYLSSNDSSLVPKSVVDRYGRNLTLSNVAWRVQSNVAIDYVEIPDSYTAVATYTGTAYKSVVTGYTVTAQYRGIISKTIVGKTTYIASFIGTQIIPPTIEQTTTLEITTETTLITTIEAASEIETATEIPTVLTVTKPINPIVPIVIIIVSIVGIIGYYFYCKKK